MKSQYEPIAPFNKQQSVQEFASGDTERIVRALLGATNHESDWEWVESRCLEYLDSPVQEVRNVAITCLGHLARIHQKINKSRVLAALARHRANPDVAGRIEDAIDDIEIFVKA